MTNRRPSHYRGKYRHDLSPRERQVLSLVTRGKTNGEIAHDLGLAFDTVKSHVSGILSKLDVVSREDAAAYWREYNSVGARFGRTLHALAAPFATRAVLVAAGGATAVVAGAAIVAAFYLSLAKDDPSVLVESQAPTPRIGLADALSTAPHAGPWHLVAGGALWYQSPSGLQRYDLDTHVSETAPGTAVANGIAHSNGIVWAIAEGRNGVVGFDANSGQRVRNIDFEDRTPSDMTWLLATPDKIYVSSFTLDSVFRVDIASGRTDAWRVVAKPKGMVIAGGSLWVPVSREDKILRLNPDTLEVEASIELETTRTHSTCGSCVQGVRASADSIWAVSDDGIAGALLGQVSQVDILSNEVLATHQFAGQISDNFAVDSSGDAWVGFRENGHSDGELVRIDGFTSLIEERIPLAFGTGSLELTTPLGVMVEGDSIIVLTREAKTARVRMAP